MKRFFLAALLLGAWGAAAQNPVIRDQFTADPTARVFDGRVYLYPSHDIPAPEGQRADWFCMEDYHVFSSENLTEWRDHGVVVTQRGVPWVQENSYSMWAPDCVCKDGRYYFYFPAAPKGGKGFAVGVATADRPEGPFTCEAEPIRGVSGIDPCVLVDDDGAAYIYWSGMGIRGARLKGNMKELEGELTTMELKGAPEGAPASVVVGGQTMEGLPEGFKEGPFAFKRNGIYYLTFPWVRGDTSGGANPTETLAYATARSPLGPWDFRGIIMAEHENGCWTNHHSMVEYGGEWYLFYHHNDLSPKDDKRRSVCIDRVQFNADGTIREVKPTLRGVGTNKATERIEIDRFSAASAGVGTEWVDTTNYRLGTGVLLPTRGCWMRYDEVDFSVLERGYVVVCAKANANTEFCIREKSARGKVLARMKMTVLNEQGRFRRDMSGQWMTLTAPLAYVPRGVTDVVITCEGEGVCIDWVQFKNREQYFAPAAASPSKPDAEGFIRRWMLLEPMEKPNPSNVVFVDSYLRDALAKEYFRGQFTTLPKDGQKVRAEGQTLTWHAVESNRYNVKLFRFADQLDKPVYGVLFWAVTVIDCEEEMQDVRLAVGSNSASMWWLNGEEALLLSGDRRMVEDDGMSPRLTLKRGRNILRGAIINGPGMSDFCVRFIDEKGQPVKNLSINHQ